MSRRALLGGGVAIVGLGVAAVLVMKAPAFFGPHYPPSPLDDLLSRLPDREGARRLGSAVLAQQKSFDTRTAVRQLRARFRSSSLSDAMTSDLRQDRLIEVHGWVLPEALTTLCAIAAKVT
jgi:hypothetical protein